MILRQLLAAYHALKKKERQQKQYDALVATPMNYTILKELINSARFDVRIDVTMKDGTRLEIRREDAFDKLRTQREFDSVDAQQRW